MRSGKEKLRKYCLKKLQNAKKHKGFKNNFLVLNKLDKILQDMEFKNILLYLPLKNEVDLRKLFRKLRAKHNLLVPFMQGISFKVVKYRLPIFRKQFSIYEPKNSLRIFKEIDIMVVPVVGVDGNLKRIGFGKGMYDRYFGSLEKKPLVIFVQLDLCCTKFVVSDSYDIQADIYITPKKIITKRGTYDNRSRDNSRNSRSKYGRRVFSSKKNQ
ncbi:MAG: 5-formyltetrahydrofolate cyclo-ligase [Proteobacteria bacterium]|nr:MAG: 5-formyltetrahydrofolate cyclo-ligase [Pseudomonadota bacterium]